MIRKLLTGMLLCFSTSTAAAEEPQALNEEQVFRRWLSSSVEVASWRSQIGAARFDVVTARLLPNPELMLSVNQLVNGYAPDAKTGYTAQLTVPLPIFGQRGARREAAEALVSVAEANTLGTLWQRASDIQGEMVEQAFADAHVSMYEKNLTELARVRKIIETRTAAGANSAYDVLRVNAAETTARAALRAATTERMAAESRLLALVADPSLDRARITREGLVAFQGPENETGLVAMAMERRPDLALARRSQVAAERSAERWRKDAIPTPSVFGAAYLVEGPQGFVVTGGVNIPLPVFDRNQGQVGRATTEAQMNELAAKSLEVRIKNEVQGAWRAREAARAALKEFRDASLPTANELLRRAEVTYQAGTFSIADLFDAYRAMWEVRAQELDLEKQMATAEATLERAAVLLPISR